MTHRAKVLPPGAAPASAIELRAGRWQEALADVECDALITDPPYSERTHDGHNDGSGRANKPSDGRHRQNRKELDYSPLTAAGVAEFVAAWAPRTRGWIVALTDHVLAPAWENALKLTGRYVFAPLQFMAPGSRVRISGDGPALWSITIVVARPSTGAYARWGALPGGYVLPARANDRSSGNGVIGGKPLWLMQALVRDYSRPGDLICDPCAGGATTLLAAAIEGRRGIGAEMDLATHAKALKRIAKGYTPRLNFGTTEPADHADQLRRSELALATQGAIVFDVNDTGDT